jgi:hypothetical protein
MMENLYDYILGPLVVGLILFGVQRYYKKLDDEKKKIEKELEKVLADNKKLRSRTMELKLLLTLATKRLKGEPINDVLEEFINNQKPNA